MRGVPHERAAAIFGKPRQQLSPREQQDFEDFMMWRMCELSAKHDLPFQIHTGQARIQGSNPMLLVDLIEAQPRTKFILFHGGFPWIGETGVIAMRFKNVWIDSVWLPCLTRVLQLSRCPMLADSSAEAAKKRADHSSANGLAVGSGCVTKPDTAQRRIRSWISLPHPWLSW